MGPYNLKIGKSTDFFIKGIERMVSSITFVNASEFYCVKHGARHNCIV